MDELRTQNSLNQCLAVENATILKGLSSKYVTLLHYRFNINHCLSQCSEA